MEKGKVSIILPERLYFSKSSGNIYGAYGACSPEGETEYILYYKNFIYPYSGQLDICVSSDYGKAYTNFWKFDGVCDKESFDITVKVYSEYGEFLCEKTSRAILTEQSLSGNLLCIGDSMTRAGVYISQTLQMLPNVKAIGSRCFDGRNYAEGRGGWKTSDYMEMKGEKEGSSPFLFPKGISGKKYLGSAEFWQFVKEKSGDYCCVGFENAAKAYNMAEFDENGFPKNAVCGDYILKGSDLYIKTDFGWEKTEKDFEFSFSKYMERNLEFFGGKTPDAVSLLLGANDFYYTEYDGIKDEIERNISRYCEIINSVKEYNEDIKIIINLPVLSAGTGKDSAYAVGTTAKKYRYNILSWCESLIDKWDNEESRKSGIYISSMLCFVDTELGFGANRVKLSKYFPETCNLYENWVHPNNSGYRQMGDILAATLGGAL